jgi:hypothetical protein
MNKLKNDIKMDLREIVFESVDWIRLAKEADRWRDLVKTVINLRIFSKGEKFLDKLRVRLTS